MNIAFICAGLEPGRDGVGDYCRSLAAELKHLGHDAALAGLNDPCAGSVEESKDSLPVLRLPQNVAWDPRMALCQSFLEKCGADWVSFQFVCYGFHPKGFVHQMPRVSRPLINGRKVHIMFHELWIGAAKNSGLKDRWVGRLQRALILKWVRSIRPQAVHTTNSAYRQLLAGAGISAIELPLFGNIPICPGNGDWMRSQLARIGISDAVRGEYWLFALFGGIPPEWSAAGLLERLWAMADAKRKKIAVLSIGRHGAGEETLIRAEREFKDRVQFLRLGPQPEPHISELLIAADYGVATVPWNLFGKSSAASTMLDHGLPVIVTRNDVQFNFPVVPSTDPRVILLDDTFEQRFSAARRRAPQSSRPGRVADFLTALESCSI